MQYSNGILVILLSCNKHSLCGKENFFIFTKQNPHHLWVFCAKFNWNWANGSKEVGNLKSLQTTDRWTLDKRWYEKFTSAFMHMCAERILWLEIQEGPHVGFSFLPCYTLFRWSKYFHLQCLYILFHYQCIFKTVKLMHHIYFSIIYKFINKWYFFKKIVFLLCAQIALILILNTVKW